MSSLPSVLPPKGKEVEAMVTPVGSKGTSKITKPVSPKVLTPKTNSTASQTGR
jgi:hypothetical protein